MSKKNIFLKESCRGIGPWVRYTKNQLPRQKTLAKNFVRSVTIFRPEKTTKIAQLGQKSIFFKNSKSSLGVFGQGSLMPKISFLR